MSVVDLVHFDRPYLHLDAEYRRRWEEYHMADGRVWNSCRVNWRQLEWEKVVKVVVSVLDHRYEVTPDGKTDFLFFMRFRWGGQVAQFDGKGEFAGYKPINLWTIGWTDGDKAYLQDIDFKSGKRVREYATPLRKFSQHIHPRIRRYVRFQ